MPIGSRRFTTAILGLWLIASAAGLAGAPARAATLGSVTLDTTAISGTPALLAWDFIDGGPPANTLTISGFVTDGALGATSSIGDVSGTAPGDFTLGDASFFTEHTIEITLGNGISFSFSATDHPPDPGSVPDGFSLFLLDAANGLPLLGTTDPSGADALLRFDITGDALGLLDTYAAPGQEVLVSAKLAAPAPEPASAALLLAGLAALCLGRSHRAPSP